MSKVFYFKHEGWIPECNIRLCIDEQNFVQLLATCFMLVSCMAYSLTLEMEVTCSSKTSVDFQWTAQCYISEDRTLLNIMVLIAPFFMFPNWYNHPEVQCWIIYAGDKVLLNISRNQRRIITGILMLSFCHA
jgi:hypothetical protein